MTDTDGHEVGWVQPIVDHVASQLRRGTMTWAQPIGFLMAHISGYGTSRVQSSLPSLVEQLERRYEADAAGAGPPFTVTDTARGLED